MARFVAAAAVLKTGDPMDLATDIGPMVDAGVVQRTERWVAEAVADGAKVPTGGTGEGLFFRPTTIVNAQRSAQVCAEEAFAPLVVAFPSATSRRPLPRSTPATSACRRASSPTISVTPGAPSRRSTGAA